MRFLEKRVHPLAGWVGIGEAAAPACDLWRTEYRL